MSESTMRPIVFVSLLALASSVAAQSVSITKSAYLPSLLLPWKALDGEMGVCGELGCEISLSFLRCSHIAQD